MFGDNEQVGGTVPISDIRIQNPGLDCQGPGRTRESPSPMRGKRRELEGTNHLCSVAALPTGGIIFVVPRQMDLDSPACPQSSLSRDV